MLSISCAARPPRTKGLGYERRVTCARDGRAVETRNDGVRENEKRDEEGNGLDGERAKGPTDNGSCCAAAPGLDRLDARTYSK